MLEQTYLALAALSVNPNQIGVPTSTGDLGSGMTKVVSLLIYLIGSLSIIFLIVGGLQLALSGGSPARVKQGRETILYSCVGLVIAIAAQAVVLFITQSVK
jgi:hypothetical protein